MEQRNAEQLELELLSPLGGYELSDVERFIANLLLDASRESPIGIKKIILEIERQKGFQLNDRKVKGIIRTLRKDHALRIISSRKPPAGYWWCRSAEEMAEFVETFKAQALDEYHTISKMLRHNYPELLGQLSFEDAL